jgi:hypothetical protein
MKALKIILLIISIYGAAMSTYLFLGMSHEQPNTTTITFNNIKLSKLNEALSIQNCKQVGDGVVCEFSDEISNSTSKE